MVLRQKVPASVLTAAKRAINARLGQPGRSFVPHTGSADTSKRRPPSGFDETELPLEQEEGSAGKQQQPQFNGRLGVSNFIACQLICPCYSICSYFLPLSVHKCFPVCSLFTATHFSLLTPSRLTPCTGGSQLCQGLAGACPLPRGAPVHRSAAGGAEGGPAGGRHQWCAGGIEVPGRGS